MSSKIVPIEQAKKLVAYYAADQMFETCKNLKAVGIGSGSTVIYSVQRIAERVKASKLSIKFVPTSFQAKQLIADHDLALGELEIYDQLDCTIDGADEVDLNCNLIKGGGGCLTQEKIIASCSNRLMIICDYTKVSSHLGQQWTKGVPIEVIPFAWVPIRKKLENLFGGKALLRMAVKKAGPVVTDNGNFIIDWQFDVNQMQDWEKINSSIKMIPGVVETGLFLNMASNVYYCSKDGNVQEIKKQL